MSPDINITESQSVISLFLVNPSLSEHPTEDALLRRYTKQFSLDKREQSSDFDEVFSLPVENSVNIIHRNGKHLWFITNNSDIVGYVTVMWQSPPIKSCVLISDFYIDKKYRGRGFGKRSMMVTIAKIFEHYPQTERICLAVLSDNVIAKKLYKDIGFSTKLETMILEKRT